MALSLILATHTQTGSAWVLIFQTGSSQLITQRSSIIVNKCTLPIILKHTTEEIHHHPHPALLVSCITDNPKPLKPQLSTQSSLSRWKTQLYFLSWELNGSRVTWCPSSCAWLTWLCILSAELSAVGRCFSLSLHHNNWGHMIPKSLKMLPGHDLSPQARLPMS